jgi:ABC-type phosphate/phosphonate transport system substrate-binding protein
MQIRERAIPLAAVVFGLAASVGAGPAKEPAAVKIGMLSSMFRDIKPAMFTALARPFYSLVEAQTGLKSELLLVPTADELRQRMDSGDIQFGVFHGFEFAWMQQKSPALQPLMIAVPLYRPLKVFLVVHESNAAKGLADLKGTTLALPGGTREHTRLFIERGCLKEGRPILEFFGKVTGPANAEEALHDVAENANVQAAVVDVAGMECFRARNPGRFKKLKVIVTSEVFPESVVAVRPGAIDADVVRRFKDGMANAHATPLGRQLMSMWAMTGFQPIPSGFQKQLADIAKAYPAPDAPPVAAAK